MRKLGTTLCRIALVGALAVGGLLVAPGGAHAAEDKGWIVNVRSGKCADASNWGAGLEVIQWTCPPYFGSQWDHQLWIFDYWTSIQQVSIRNEKSDKCMDAEDFGRGTRIIQFTCSGNANQRWRIEEPISGQWRFVNVASGKCLDASNWGRDAQLIQYPCHRWNNDDDAHQRWRITHLDPR
jgi:hypothetical protein